MSDMLMMLVLKKKLIIQNIWHVVYIGLNESQMLPELTKLQSEHFWINIQFETQLSKFVVKLAINLSGIKANWC